MSHAETLTQRGCRPTIWVQTPNRQNTYMATITPRGNRFQVKVRKSGTTRSHTCDTREEAEAWGRHEEAAIEAGSAEALEGSKKLTVADLAQLYFEFSNNAPDIENSVVSIKLAPFANEPVFNLTPSRILAWQPERNNITQTLSDILDKGRSDFGIWFADNPVKVAYAKDERKRLRRLSTNEEASILDAAMKSNTAYLYDIIVIALETALKLGELLELNWSNVRLDYSDMVITGRKGTRVIPLTKTAIGVLINRSPNTHGLVFPNLKENTLQTNFYRLVKSLGIDDLSFKDLRHEAIFRMKSRHTFEEIKHISGIEHRSLEPYFE